MHLLTNIPTIPNRTRIPAETIQALVDEIVTRFHPQKVILFGSYARNHPKPESDVDLLVIMTTEISEIEQAAKICRGNPYRFGLDLIVCNPQNLIQRLEWGDSFL